jgi:poly-gamma-glutamate synthesis protein (capsule biosynthesis protein)
VWELASTWVATDGRSGEAHAIDANRTITHRQGRGEAGQTEHLAEVTGKKRADIVLAFMHWGTEGVSCPDSDQKSLAPKLAAAGADIIGARARCRSTAGSGRPSSRTVEETSYGG